MSTVLYSTNCPKCNVLKKKLDEKGVDYIINNDVDEMTELGMMEVPMLSVDGKLLSFTQAVAWANEM